MTVGKQWVGRHWVSSQANAYYYHKESFQIIRSFCNCSLGIEEIRELPPRPQQSICFSHNRFVNPKNLGLWFHLLPIENYTIVVLSDTVLLIIEI
jgi:hypothetical protein